jgi:(1->4)-alpha-D-glucan 1-alpha-D-glucosylmutase
MAKTSNQLTATSTVEPYDTISTDATTRGPTQDSIGNLVNRIVGEVEQHLKTARLPSATYRVQFNNRCSFREIEAIVPYLYTLGISDLYASPFLQARPGSPHGYDVINHSAINPEIGTLEELRSLRSALREHDMGLLADVVPNHMSATPQLNSWWHDVLENGPSSAFASHFDIDWMPLKPDLADKVLLPVLGDQYGKVLESGQLVVHYAEGSFWLVYYDRQFPLAPRSYTNILGLRLQVLTECFEAEHSDHLEFLSILTAIGNLPTRTETDPKRLVERRREKGVIKRRLHELVQRSATIADFISENVRLINGQSGIASSFNQLDELLQNQAFRLAFWRVAADEINYRRFFDINELAAICTELPQVFAESHKLLFELLDEGTITGMRIDHPDGLYDPHGYFVQLQERQFLRLCREAWIRIGPQDSGLATDDALWTTVWERLLALWRSATRIIGSPLGRPLYIVVEKILALGEALPEDWPVHGTVGYEFLNSVNGLFVDPRGEAPLSQFYSRFTGQSLDIDELSYQCKRLIVRMSMASELTVLGHRLDRISERNRWTRDFTLNSLTRALQEVISGFRVYRSYVEPQSVLERDRRCIKDAVETAKRRNPAMDTTILDFVQNVLLLNFHEHADEEERAAVVRFVGKFQQLTGPIMAKAVEDTTFYRFNRLVSLNEVGGEPDHFGTSTADFHIFQQSRLPRLSHSLNSTSTHDTKRSEDVRARINVLSEIPREWSKQVLRWSKSNAKLTTQVGGVTAPSKNAEYLLYQTLVGTWPNEFPTGHDRAVYAARIQEYLLKVVREAKVHTSWVSPNDAYELALSQFITGVFAGKNHEKILRELDEFSSRVAEHGRWNSLSQILLKIASPGVPDFYQGTELWNLTLVDPDNRHPVDLAGRRDTLDALLNTMADALGLVGRSDVIRDWLKPGNSGGRDVEATVTAFLKRLLDQRQDGVIKLFTTLMALQIRREFPNLFSMGRYEPLMATGRHADQVVAFMRTDRDQCSIVVVPRMTVSLTGFGGPTPIGEIWADTRIILPIQLRERTFANIFTRVIFRPVGDLHLAASTAFSVLPFCILVSNANRQSNDTL